MEITLRNVSGLEVKLLSLGATVRSFLVPDREGRVRDIVLGYDTAEEYFYGKAYFGACVGRVCNRIAGSCFSLSDRQYSLIPNEGKNQLHGGPVGFSRRIWTPVVLSDQEVLFRLFSPDEEMGFPGNLNAEVRYYLSDDNSLSIRYRAESDRETPFSPTNHSYFNLMGQESGSVGEHRLWIHADAYTPTDSEMIPTGEILPLPDYLDFSAPRPLNDCFRCPELAGTKGLDHNFVLREGNIKASLEAPDGSLKLEMQTDRPAVQVYTAGSLSGKGKNGVLYHDHQGVCLETQGYPDAVHHSDFPSVLLEAGKTWESETVYRIIGAGRTTKKREGVKIFMKQE